VFDGSTNRTWLFANHPDFGAMHGVKAPSFKLVYQIADQAPAPRDIKSWKSTLQVVEGGKVVREQTIEVNAPLAHRGYTFYQSGYNPRDPAWTSLMVVRDPGVLLVYTGFLLMIAGLVVVFYVYPRSGGGRQLPADSEGGPDLASGHGVTRGDALHGDNSRPGGTGS
jgi:hypothetical protein